FLLPSLWGCWTSIWLDYPAVRNLALTVSPTVSPSGRRRRRSREGVRQASVAFSTGCHEQPFLLVVGLDDARHAPRARRPHARHCPGPCTQQPLAHPVADREV